MPRVARIVAPQLPHHITQRGNYRQNIFLDDNDRKQYLLWVQEYSFKYGLSILSYCLMSNHVHFIAIPEKKDSLARTFNTAHMRYSQHFNKKIKAYGHLWQGRFFSCVLDESHLIAASSYIERNPVRAKLVQKPWFWKWSSAKAHINNKEEKSLLKLGNLFDIIDMNHNDWKKLLELAQDQKLIDKVRKHTLSGRPLGSASFIQTLEHKLKRRLIALHRGRPKKTQE